MLFQVLMLVLMISLCMYEAFTVENYLSTKFSARANLVVCVINDIFIYSHRGENIQHDSQMISDEIYDSYWYKVNFSRVNKRISKEFQTLIQLTMMRARRPVKISAGGFTTMSYQTFMSVSITILSN
jgi:7tm Odorant receptor